MYKPVKVHIPEKLHEKLKSLVVQDKVIPIKIDLINGDDILLLTPGQILKMENAKNVGKNQLLFALVENNYEQIFITRVDFSVHSWRWLQKFYQLYLLDSHLV